MMTFIKQFNEFKKTMSGRDPQAIVQDLLSSGRMSQNQFRQLSSMAEQISNILK